MVTKSNFSSAVPVSRDELKGYLESSYLASSRAKKSQAEAAAYAYIAYRAVMYGKPKELFKAEITSYEDHAKKKNEALSKRFKDADDYARGALSPDHEVYQKTKTKEEKERQEAMIAKFKADSAMSKSDRRKLRFVSLDISRSNANKFMPIVRGALRAYHESHNWQVSQYCHALEWIDTRFKDIPDLNVAMIKQAFSVAHGFEACVLEQSKLKGEENDDEKNQIIKAAIRALTRSKVEEIEAVAEIDMTVSETKDGYFLALARVVDGKVKIIRDAGCPEIDIASAVNRVGSGLALDVDPASEFLGRGLTISEIIPEGQTIMASDGEKSLGKTSRLVSVRPGEDGISELVISVSLAEVGPVLIARPKDPDALGLQDAAAVIRTQERKKLEREVRDPGNRSLVTFTTDLQPTTADGKPAESFMSWNFVNEALVAADMMDKAVTKVYFSKLDNIGEKPLDVVDFKPQLTGSIDGTAINSILALVPKPRAASKNAEPDEEGEKTKSRVEKFATFKFKDDKLIINYGDADTLELDCKTDRKGTVIVRLRTADIWNIFNKLHELDCQNVEISPDDRGLVRFGWVDTVGSYGYHQPICGTDGRLQSRRVAPMRYEAPLQIAAE